MTRVYTHVESTEKKQIC